MKKPVLLVIACISIMMSCKKEITTSEKKVSNALKEYSMSVSSEKTLSDSSTKFGALIHDRNLSADEKVKVCNALGVKYARNSIVLKGFSGKDAAVEAYLKNGFKVFLNLNYGHVQAPGGKRPVPYPTDMNEYKSLVEKVLNKYTPYVAIIENEETNSTYHTGDIEDYITELKTAVDICKSRGIMVADGGLNTAMVSILVYRDFVERGMQEAADEFGRLALSSNNLRTAKGFGTADANAKLLRTQKLVNAMKTIDLNYVNIHFHAPWLDYDPTRFPPKILKQIADYLRSVTGKEVICGEFSEHSKSSNLITSIVNEIKAGGYSYGIVFSGEGINGAEPLNDGVRLLENGVAFKLAIQ
jgi:hypothetical protein